MHCSSRLCERMIIISKIEKEKKRKNAEKFIEKNIYINIYKDIWRRDSEKKNARKYKSILIWLSLLNIILFIISLNILINFEGYSLNLAV